MTTESTDVQNGQTAAPTPPSSGLIPPGVYQMTAQEAELGYTQGNADSPPAPQVAVLLVFADGPFQGQALTWYGYFSEKTKAGTIRALRAIGWTGTDLANLTTARGTAPCTVQTDVDLDGVPRSRVRWVGGGGLAMKNVMSEDQKKAFSASMAGFIQAVGGAPQTTSPSSSPEKSKGKGGKFF